MRSIYLTQVNVTRGLNKAEYFQLCEMCFFSNCPYAFKSLFGSIGKVKGARLPRYRRKGDLYNLIIAGNSISIQNGFLTVPQSRTYTSVLNNHRIKIKIPERLVGKKIREVKIIPLYKGRAFKIVYCYEADEQDLNLNRENALAIDIALDNLAMCVTDFGTSFIMDRRKIKQINRNWNKSRAHLQLILMKQGCYLSKLLERITLKRNNRVNDCLKKTARYIVNFCIANDIGTLCSRYDMNYIEQEESYTSKASFLDLDELPIYDAEKSYTGTFSGKKIKRGFY